MSTIEVCPICDIAGCAHIRAKGPAPAQGTPWWNATTGEVKIKRSDVYQSPVIMEGNGRPARALLLATIQALIEKEDE